MKTNTEFDDIAALESELAEFAPLVRRGFDRAGPPSAHTEEAIRAEARRFLAGRTRARFAWFRPRTLAAAAALALLLGGSVNLLVSHQPGRADDTDRRSAAAAKAQTDDSTAGYASLLLEIQGLNEESFFRTEEAESLWL
jgi:hypothetical protein